MSDQPHAEDLVYAGRERKRPPGASDLVQRIYALLHDHPDGMTLDELHEVLREGWLETDAYRAYDQYLVKNRQSYRHAASVDRIALLNKGSGAYGTEGFKRRAQRWWISQALRSMVESGSAQREGPIGQSRWFKGDAPRIVKEGKTTYYAQLNVEEQRAAHHADTQAHIRREQIKARFLADLNDPKLRTATRKNIEHLRETIRLGYEYLSGR